MLLNPYTFSIKPQIFITKSLIGLSIIFGLSIIMLSSCKKKQQHDSPLDEFRALDSASLSGKDIPLESDTTLFDPRTISVFDSVGILYDNSGIFGYAVINLKTGKLMRRFAYAQEDSLNLDLQSLRLNSSSGRENEFTILQSNSPAKVLRYNLDSLVDQKKYKPLVFRLSGKIHFTDAVLNDNRVFGKFDFSGLDNNLFGSVALKNDELSTGVSLPKLKNSKNSYDPRVLPWMISTLGGTVKRRPNTNEFAYFSTKGALIQIIKNENTDAIKVQYEKLYYLPEFKIVVDGKITKPIILGNCRNGFNDIAVTQDRIYALYNGKSAASNDVSDLLSNTILVYDWEGKPIRKIILDQDFYSISINEKTRTLYCLRSFYNVGIRKYDLAE